MALLFDSKRLVIIPILKFIIFRRLSAPVHTLCFVRSIFFLSPFFPSKQNGVSEVETEFVDPSNSLFIRNSRDLATIAFTDLLYTEAFRAALILFKEGLLGGAVGPYADAVRQQGFATFGAPHILTSLASSSSSTRHAWYAKVGRLVTKFCSAAGCTYVSDRGCRVRVKTRGAAKWICRRSLEHHQFEKLQFRSEMRSLFIAHAIAHACVQKEKISSFSSNHFTGEGTKVFECSSDSGPSGVPETPPCTTKRVRFLGTHYTITVKHTTPILVRPG